MVIVAILLVVVIFAGVWTIVSKQQTQNISQDKQGQSKTYTMDEVAQHNSKSDCWTVISDDVYNLTGYVNRHPGGDEILRACGKDGTELFDSRTTTDGQPVGSGTRHSQAAEEQLVQLKIGTLSNE